MPKPNLVFLAPTKKRCKTHLAFTYFFHSIKCCSFNSSHVTCHHCHQLNQLEIFIVCSCLQRYVSHRTSAVLVIILDNTFNASLSSTLTAYITFKVDVKSTHHFNVNGLRMELACHCYLCHVTAKH